MTIRKRKLLYKKKLNTRISENIRCPECQRIKIGSLYIKGERKTFKQTIVRLVFFIISKGRCLVFYYKDKFGIIEHKSFVLPKCYKFPFMSTNDYEIGPCFTEPEYRGHGLYVKMLNWITSQQLLNKGNFYMIVDEDNIASIKGIEKAGFTICGFVKKTVLLRYILVS